MLAGLLGTLVRSMRRRSWEAEHAPWQALTPEQEAELAEAQAGAEEEDARDVEAFVNINALLHEAPGRPDEKVLTAWVARMSGRAIMCALIIETALADAARCKVGPVSAAAWKPQLAAVRARYTTTLANGSRHLEMPKRAFQVLVCFRCRVVRSPCVTSAPASYEERQTAGPSMVGVLPCPSCADIPSLRDTCTTCSGQGRCLECVTRVAAAYVTKGCSGRDRSALTAVDLESAVLHMDGAVYSWCASCGVLYKGPTANGCCWACNAQWMLLPFAERRLRCMTGAEASAVALGGGFRGAGFMSPMARPRFCAVCSDNVESSTARYVWMAQPRLGPDGKMQPLTPTSPAVMRLVWLCWKHSMRGMDLMLQLVPHPTPEGLSKTASASLSSHQKNLVGSQMKGRGRPREGRSAILPPWLRAASGMLPSRSESDAIRPFLTVTDGDLKEAQEVVLASVRMAQTAWSTPENCGGVVDRAWNRAAETIATDPAYYSTPPGAAARRRPRAKPKLAKKRARKKVAFAEPGAEKLGDTADDNPRVRFAEAPPGPKRQRKPETTSGGIAPAIDNLAADFVLLEERWAEGGTVADPKTLATARNRLNFWYTTTTKDGRGVPLPLGALMQLHGLVFCAADPPTNEELHVVRKIICTVSPGSVAEFAAALGPMPTSDAEWKTVKAEIFAAQERTPTGLRTV